jgi:hypothetical protein
MPIVGANATKPHYLNPQDHRNNNVSTDFMTTTPHEIMLFASGEEIHLLIGYFIMARNPFLTPTPLHRLECIMGLEAPIYCAASSSQRRFMEGPYTKNKPARICC